MFSQNKWISSVQTRSWNVPFHFNRYWLRWPSSWSVYSKAQLKNNDNKKLRCLTPLRTENDWEQYLPTCISISLMEHISISITGVFGIRNPIIQYFLLQSESVLNYTNSWCTVCSYSHIFCSMWQMKKISFIVDLSPQIHTDDPKYFLYGKKLPMTDPHSNVSHKIELFIALLWEIKIKREERIKNSVALVHELWRSSDRRLSAKLLQTSGGMVCCVVSAIDPHGRILGYLDQSR
jgi:hypothetical protein